MVQNSIKPENHKGRLKGVISGKLLYLGYLGIEFLLSITLFIVLAIPGIVIQCVREAVTRKPGFVHRNIIGVKGKPLKLTLLNVNNWLLRHSILFGYVILGKLKLAGISFVEYYESLIENREPLLLEQKPGIFSLHFIQCSSKIAAVTQHQSDLEYLDRDKGFREFSVLLMSIPALLHYHESDDTNSELVIFDIKMLNITMIEAIELINQRIAHKLKTPVFFVNPDCLNKAYINREYHEILRQNEVVFPDGIGIHYAGKLLGTPLKQNLNGTDMLPFICELAVKQGYRLFLLGAAPTIADTMKDKLVDKYNGLNICGTQDGFFNWEIGADKIIQEINDSKADIVLVAMGAPMQERFISQYGSRINASILMGVGGLFDFYSERMARAPLWMRRIGLEWVFRLILEPKRMWKRYILGNPLFLYRVLVWKNKRRHLSHNHKE